MTLEFKIIEQILSEIMSLGLKSIVQMLPERVLLGLNVSKYLPQKILLEQMS